MLLCDHQTEEQEEYSAAFSFQRAAGRCEAAGNRRRNGLARANRTGANRSMGDGAGDPLTKGRRVMARKRGRASAKPGGTAGVFRLLSLQQRSRGKGFSFCLILSQLRNEFRN